MYIYAIMGVLGIFSKNETVTRYFYREINPLLLLNNPFN